LARLSVSSRQESAARDFAFCPDPRAASRCPGPGPLAASRAAAYGGAHKPPHAAGRRPDAVFSGRYVFSHVGADGGAAAHGHSNFPSTNSDTDTDSLSAHTDADRSSADSAAAAPSTDSNADRAAAHCDADPGTDPNANSNSAAADSDPDADTDENGDSDGRAAHREADADGNAYTDADCTSAHGDSDADALYSDTDADTDADGHEDADAHENVNTDRRAADGHSDRGAADTDAHTDSLHRDPDAHCDSDLNFDAHPDTDTDADGHENANTDRRTADGYSDSDPSGSNTNAASPDTHADSPGAPRSGASTLPPGIRAFRAPRAGGPASARQTRGQSCLSSGGLEGPHPRGRGAACLGLGVWSPSGDSGDPERPRGAHAGGGRGRAAVDVRTGD